MLAMSENHPASRRRLNVRKLLLALAIPPFASAPATPTATDSRAELARGYDDRAIDLLRRAVSLGFRDVDLLTKDPDLAALRDRADFRLLILDVAFPSDPFSPAR